MSMLYLHLLWQLQLQVAAALPPERKSASATVSSITNEQIFVASQLEICAH
jgi:hypothetical protein